MRKRKGKRAEGRGQRAERRRATLPDICREIGREFFAAASGLERTGQKIRNDLELCGDGPFGKLLKICQQSAKLK